MCVYIYIYELKAHPFNPSAGAKASGYLSPRTAEPPIVRPSSVKYKNRKIYMYMYEVTHIFTYICI